MEAVLAYRVSEMIKPEQVQSESHKLNRDLMKKSEAEIDSKIKEIVDNCTLSAEAGEMIRNISTPLPYLEGQIRCETEDGGQTVSSSVGIYGGVPQYNGISVRQNLEVKVTEETSARISSGVSNRNSFLQMVGKAQISEHTSVIGELNLGVTGIRAKVGVKAQGKVSEVIDKTNELLKGIVSDENLQKFTKNIYGTVGNIAETMLEEAKTNTQEKTNAPNQVDQVTTKPSTSRAKNDKDALPKGFEPLFNTKPKDHSGVLKGQYRMANNNFFEKLMNEAAEQRNKSSFEPLFPNKCNNPTSFNKEQCQMPVNDGSYKSLLALSRNPSNANNTENRPTFRVKPEVTNANNQSERPKIQVQTLDGKLHDLKSYGQHVADETFKPSIEKATSGFKPINRQLPSYNIETIGK